MEIVANGKHVANKIHRFENRRVYQGSSLGGFYQAHFTVFKATINRIYQLGDNQVLVAYS